MEAIERQSATSASRSTGQNDASPATARGRPRGAQRRQRRPDDGSSLPARRFQPSR
jgi:hypothetical protein